MNSQPAVVSVK